MSEYHPSKKDLIAAKDKTVPDILAPGLKIVFCGINPGLYSAAVGHHFGRPGNRFWPALYEAGLTPHLFSPFEDGNLLELGFGITNIVTRASAGAAELSKEELAEGGKVLADKILRFKPVCMAVLGIGAYRSAFNRPKAQPGLQPDKIGSAILWALPNPSGLNAHFSLEDFARLFRELYNYVDNTQ